MAKPYGLANQELYYIQMPLNVENSGEQEKDRLRMVGKYRSRSLKIVKSFCPCQPVRTVQVDMDCYFFVNLCIRPPFQRAWLK